MVQDELKVPTWPSSPGTTGFTKKTKPVAEGKQTWVQTATEHSKPGYCGHVSLYLAFHAVLL